MRAVHLYFKKSVEHSISVLHKHIGLLSQRFHPEKHEHASHYKCCSNIFQRHKRENIITSNKSESGGKKKKKGVWHLDRPSENTERERQGRKKDRKHDVGNWSYRDSLLSLVFIPCFEFTLSFVFSYTGPPWLSFISEIFVKEFL